MKSYEERHAAAKSIYAAGLVKVKTTPAPEGQKFPVGCPVRIADDLGCTMRGFTSGVNATVEYTYAHAYGGTDIKSYSLNIEGKGSTAWYHEHQLTEIK